MPIVSADLTYRNLDKVQLITCSYAMYNQLYLVNAQFCIKIHSQSNLASGAKKTSKRTYL